MDGIGIKVVCGYDFFDFVDIDLVVFCCRYVEIVCCFVKDYIVGFVGFLVFDDGDIGDDVVFKDIGFVVEIFMFFVFGDYCVDVGFGVEFWNVCIVCVYLFG